MRSTELCEVFVAENVRLKMKADGDKSTGGIGDWQIEIFVLLKSIETDTYGSYFRIKHTHTNQHTSSMATPPSPSKRYKQTNY